MTQRFYYYTGAVTVDEAKQLSDKDRQAAKELVLKIHDLWQSFDEDNEVGSYTAAAKRRIQAELQRRDYAGRKALIRVLKCSQGDLNKISSIVFDTLPDILVIDQQEGSD